MKKLWAMLLLLLCLPMIAAAELSVSIDAEGLRVGETAAVTVSGQAERELRYAMYRGDQLLFEGQPGAEAVGAYRPRESGDYRLVAIARDAEGAEESAEAFFTVLSDLSCTLRCDRESAPMGGTLTFTADPADAADSLTYRWSLWIDQTRYAVYTTAAPTLTCIAPAVGALRMVLTISDPRGGEASAECTAAVTPGDGISVTGETGAFFAQGGIHTLQVHAPGVWRCTVPDDFLTADTLCGQSGDVLHLTASPTAAARIGRVQLTCGEYTLTLQISQRSQTCEDEELYLFSTPEDSLTLDGAAYLSWSDAVGERIVTVAASAPWTAQSDAAFVAVSAEGDMLTLTAAQNDTAVPRSATVTVTCGQVDACIYVFQLPHQLGADVLGVQLSAAAGQAYGDPILAQVLTTADAQQVTVTDGTQQIIADTAIEVPEGLRWEIPLPLIGSGQRSFLFAASGVDGVGRTAYADVAVSAEAPGFAEAAAWCGRQSITVLTTAATQTIELLSASQEVLGSCTAETALLDRCPNGDTTGRTIQWRIPMPEAGMPAALRIGSDTVPVKQTPLSTAALHIYDQCDGWWMDKPYRDSTLQVSGCAIFTLSHALSLLDMAGDATTPEALAKKYAFCLVDGGTLNSTLVGNAGDDLGFKTRYDLFESKNEVTKRFASGAVFSFSVVSGHIALACELSEDGGMMHIIDSALSATFTRIKDRKLYLRAADGSFAPISALSDIPGASYYIETGLYGGGDYWLESDYVLKRGVRLIQPE